MKYADLPVLLLLLALTVASSLACVSAGDDDDDNDVTPADDDDNDDSPAPDDDDDDTANPTIGACLCCFTTEGQTWGWCWNVGFDDECDAGCEQLYDEEHLLGTLFYDEASCVDYNAIDACREAYPSR